MAIKIVFLDSDSLGPGPDLGIFEKFGSFTAYPDTAPHQTIERVGDAEIVISNKVKIDRAVMDSCPKLQLICIAATGMNNVDLPYAAEKGIQVKNVAGYATESVAQVTFALLLSLLHHIAWFDHFVKSGNYSRWHSFTCYERGFSEISGKQFGIIGMGAIGKRVALIAEAFGAKVVYCSTSGKNQYDRYPSLPLPALLATSDIVSVHSPLNRDTYGLIKAEQLRTMKKSAILINTGRGKIVDEADLAEALNEGWIAGAALDVHAHEPIEADNPLLSLKEPERLIQTPHIAWAAIEARIRLTEQIARHIQTFLTGD